MKKNLLIVLALVSLATVVHAQSTVSILDGCWWNEMVLWIW